MAEVKPTRAERARLTRRRMVDAARGLFVGQGYAATTMDQIATETGGAVQTVYYTFRTKGQLLAEVAEVVEVTAAGEDYWRGVAVARRGGQRAMVARVAELGGLRPGLDADRATDLVVVLAGHDVYRGLVQDARWSATAYRAWLFTTLAQQLLVSGDIDPDAVRGLSFAGLTGES